MTDDKVKSELTYDPATGDIRVVATGSRLTPYKWGGTVGNYYQGICWKGKEYYVHRLAWLLMTGSHPSKMIDHKDGNPQNNRWDNLREATGTQNQRNRRVGSNNRLGLKGVHRVKRNKFHASIREGKKMRYLGTYDCPAAAHFAYIVEAHKLAGDYARAQ